jgi:hypothetical protein
MKNKLASLLSYDTTVPEQYFQTWKRSEHLEPEKALLLAILEDTIRDYQKYKSARDKFGRERFQEAEAWIIAKENDWIFSFENVCELLGLDPSYLRRELTAQRPIAEADKKKHA